jgi:hypothetical protein
VAWVFVQYESLSTVSLSIVLVVQCLLIKNICTSKYVNEL